MSLENDPRYRAARKRAKELRNLYSNIVSYLTICSMLVIINLITNNGNLSWAVLVIVFWGAGIIAHALNVFMPKFDKDWEERKALELMGEKRKNESNTAEDYFNDV